MMPFARLTLTPALLPDATQRLGAVLTDLIAQDLNKRQDLTSVLIETPGQISWTIGTAVQKAAAHLNVWVTSGTNTEDEKQRFIANATAQLQQALPGLAAATYVIVTELPATNWGYDGQTQAARAKQKARGAV